MVRKAKMQTRWSLHPEIEAGLGSLLPPLPFEAAEIGKDEIPAIRRAMSRPAGIPDHVRHHELVMDRGPKVRALRLHVYAPRRPADQARPGCCGSTAASTPMVDDRTMPPAGVRLAVWGGAANRLVP